MQILDGKKLSENILSKIAEESENIKKLIGRSPKICVIIIGNDLPSKIYVNVKKRACEKAGISFLLKEFDQISELDLLKLIKNLNSDNTVDGIIVQLPISKDLNSTLILDSICPKKDVDGFGSVNYGKMAKGFSTCHKPATPLGIIMLLSHYGINISGKKCAILGRGSTVGAPLSILMSQNKSWGNATVTTCHSYTKNVQEICKSSDILISAIGKKHFVTKDMIKEGAVVIDVGINRLLDKSSSRGYKIFGDVDYENVKDSCSYITPVPGGVGPMTVAALLSNLVNATKLNTNLGGVIIIG